MGMSTYLIRPLNPCMIHCHIHTKCLKHTNVLYGAFVPTILAYRRHSDGLLVIPLAPSRPVWETKGYREKISSKTDNENKGIHSMVPFIVIPDTHQHRPDTVQNLQSSEGAEPVEDTFVQCRQIVVGEVPC